MLLFRLKEPKLENAYFLTTTFEMQPKLKCKKRKYERQKRKDSSPIFLTEYKTIMTLYRKLIKEKTIVYCNKISYLNKTTRKERFRLVNKLISGNTRFLLLLPQMIV